MMHNSSANVKLQSAPRDVSISKAMDLNFLSSSLSYFVFCLLRVGMFPLFISDVLETLAFVVFLSLAVNI